MNITVKKATTTPDISLRHLGNSILAPAIDNTIGYLAASLFATSSSAAVGTMGTMFGVSAVSLSSYHDAPKCT
jgi:hypothetical protein